MKGIEICVFADVAGRSTPDVSGEHVTFNTAIDVVSKAQRPAIEAAVGQKPAAVRRTGTGARQHMARTEGRLNKA